MGATSFGHGALTQPGAHWEAIHVRKEWLSLEGGAEEGDCVLKQHIFSI